MFYEFIKKIVYLRVFIIFVLFFINMLSFLRNDIININSLWLFLFSVFIRNVIMFLFFIFIFIFKFFVKFSNK